MYNFEKSKELIENAKTIALFTHANADGDALGSSFALKRHLEGLGKEVDLFCDTTIPNQLKFLNIEDEIISEPNGVYYDLAIATDCNTLDMMGINRSKFLSIEKSIQFDHHPLNIGYATVNNLETKVSSASEIVAKYLFDINGEISDEIGELLLTGMITDSGGFKFDCTTTETMCVVAEILKVTKIKLSDLMNHLYESETMDSFEMYKYAINHTEFVLDNKVAIIKIDNKFFKDTGVDPNSCKFITRIGTEIKDVVVTALITEIEPNVSKVSFRSRGNYDASACARFFGGGGHMKAAGCKIFGSYYDVVEKVKKVIMDGFAW